MKLIFTQDTINFLHSIDPQLLIDLNVLGSPEIVEMNNGIKYYRYEEK